MTSYGTSCGRMEQVEAEVGATALPPAFLTVVRARRDTVARNLNQVVELFATRRATLEDTREVASICTDIRSNVPTIVPKRCSAF